MHISFTKVQNALLYLICSLQLRLHYNRVGIISNMSTNSFFTDLKITHQGDIKQWVYYTQIQNGVKPFSGFLNTQKEITKYRETNQTKNCFDYFFCHFSTVTPVVKKSEFLTTGQASGFIFLMLSCPEISGR